MKTKKIGIFIPVIFTVIVSQAYVFGGKTLLELEGGNNPYMLSDGSSFEVISNSEEFNQTTFEITTYNALDSDFYQSFNANYPGIKTNDGTYPVEFNLAQSDVANNKYRFTVSNDYENSNYIKYESLENFNVAVDGMTNHSSKSIDLVNDLNIDEENTFSYKPTEYENYPMIASYTDGVAPEEAFNINYSDDDSVSFTFESYGYDETFPSSFEVLLRDQNESSSIYNIKPYTANFVSKSEVPAENGTGNYEGEFYTYEISDLPPSTYSFVSFANSGMSVGNESDNEFNPNSEINLIDDLNYDSTELDFTIGEEVANPYIVDSSLTIDYIGTTDASFSFGVVDNATNDFFTSMNTTGSLEIHLKNLSLSSESDVQTVCTNAGTKPSNGIYSFHFFLPLEENTQYEIYSLNDTGLALGDATSPVDDEILVSEELHSVDTFTTANVSPFIETNSFTVSQTYYNEVDFRIRVINDSEGSFVPEDDMDVTLKQGANTYETTAHYVSSPSADTYTYKISDIGNGAPLTSGTPYEIYSLNNTGLSVGSDTSPVDGSILISEIGPTTGSFTTNVGNPHVLSQSFAITNETSSSVEFKIKVVNDGTDPFDPSDPMAVTVKDSSDVSHATTASYVRTDDTDPDVYYYQIDELQSGVPFVEGASYEIYSLDNTGLSIDNPAIPEDNQILIESDLAGDGSFTTVSVNGNPYIDTGSFTMGEITGTTAQFSIKVENDAAFNHENSLNITIEDGADVSHATTASFVKVDDVDANVYIYEITELSPSVALTPGSSYEIISLDDTGLAIGDSTATIDDEITMTDLGETSADASFTTIGNPYVESGSFSIINPTKNSVQFQITVKNNEDNDFVPETPLSVKINDAAGNPHTTTANYIETNNDVYTYEITDLEPGVALTPGSSYEIISILGSGLAVGDSTGTIDSEITISGDLAGDGNFTTMANPYIEADGFSITGSSTESVEFSLKVTDNSMNEFDETAAIDVTVKDSGNVSHQTTASYVGTDVSDPNLFTYKITELETGVSFTPGETYEIYSLNNTGLAIDGTSASDDEITIVTDLGEDGTFTVSESSYIYDQGFSILDATDTTVKFQLEISDTQGSFDNKDPLNVTLKDNDNGGVFTKDASLVTEESHDDTYVYQITNLAEEKNYEFVSLNDINLAVGDGDSTIYENINLINDLGMAEEDLKFDTIGVAYIDSENGFQIVDGSETATSVQYSLLVYNWDTSYSDTMEVEMFNKSTNQNEVHTAHLVKKDGNNYTYEISDLDSKTDYEIVSLNNTGLAVGSEDGPVNENINLTNDLNVEETETAFVTGSNLALYLIIGISILLVVLAIILGVFFWMKRSKKAGMRKKRLTGF